MRTLNDWFEEYAISHQNPKNKRIHYICVPVIYFSIIGLLMSIPNDFILSLWKTQFLFLENWAVVILLFVMIFYLRLLVLMALKMALFSLFCLVLNQFISHYVSLVYFSIIIFVIAWIGQFYGHQLEGKKPSFLKDLQFLLIGPAWVIENLFSKKI